MEAWGAGTLQFVFGTAASLLIFKCARIFVECNRGDYGG
jgi:hypothetical protein